jgi:hypothetical protein
MGFQHCAAAGRGFIIGQLSLATPTHVGVVVQWAWFLILPPLLYLQAMDKQLIIISPVFILLTWLLQR